MTMVEQTTREEIEERLKALEKELPGLHLKLKVAIEANVALEKKIRENPDHKEVLELRGKLEWSTKANDALEKRALELAEENKKLELSSAIIDLKALNEYVEELVKKHGTGSNPTPTDIDQQLTLGHITSTMGVKEVKLQLPDMDTTTPEGKIMMVVAKGLLETPMPIAKIEELVPGVPRVNVANACDSLAARSLLLKGKLSDKRLSYQRHPDLDVHIKA